ncbi:MAG: thioredoxin TrxC [Bryobacterales bacterium]|nr:thioredoxin TrxC [Bryobacterales bacterium]
MITACPSCGTKNRVPARRLADEGRCGRCKSTLPPRATPIAAEGPEQFHELISQAQAPVLVDFWAAWCGPCKAIAPELEALAREVAGEALVVKVNTEELPEIAAQFQIQSIPTLMVFRNGRLAARRSGAAPRAELRRWLASSVAA